MPALRFLPSCCALLAALLCSGAASAQILRCIDPDSGSVTYTNEAACPAHAVAAPVRPAPLPEGLTPESGAPPAATSAHHACQQAKERLNAILLREPHADRSDRAAWAARSQAAQQQVDTLCPPPPISAQDKVKFRD